MAPGIGVGGERAQKLGRWQGATENTTVVYELPEELAACGKDRPGFENALQCSDARCTKSSSS